MEEKIKNLTGVLQTGLVIALSALLGVSLTGSTLVPSLENPVEENESLITPEQVTEHELLTDLEHDADAEDAQVNDDEFVAIKTETEGESEPSGNKINGVIRVVPSEYKPVEISEGQDPNSIVPEIIEGGIDFVTDSGESLPLNGLVDPATVATGDFASVEVNGDASQGLPLSEMEIIDIEITDQDDIPTAHAGINHKLDVVFLDTNRTSMFPSRANVDAVVKRLSNFWSRETNGQVASITINQFKTQSVSWDVCSADKLAIWEAAAKMFQKTSSQYYSSSSNHLLVIVPDDRAGCGGGLATLGRTVKSGGTMLIAVPAKNFARWDQVMFHEFGHNISLNHSNGRQCTRPTIDSSIKGLLQSSCHDLIYHDFYDVMGGGMTYTYNGKAYTTHSNVPDLNVTHRAHLGAITAGNGLIAVTEGKGKTQTVKLPAATSGAKNKGLIITDPVSKDKLLVEYRSGTGRDANSFYNQLPFLDTGTGVRVMRLYPEYVTGYSTVLQRHVPQSQVGQLRLPGSKTQVPYLKKGDWIQSYSGGVLVEVTALNNSEATVKIGFKQSAPGGSSTAPKSKKVDTKRFAGADRYETSVAVSKEFFPGKAPVVYLATGSNFPDALSAAPAAAINGGPLLLVPGSPKAVSKALKDRMKQLAPSRVVVLGGTSVVSNAVVNEVVKSISKRPKIDRISGSDRFQTGIKVVQDTFKNKTVTEAIIATGNDFPDALAASGAAGTKKIPVILLNGKKTSTPGEAVNLLRSLGVKKIKIAGGTGAVSAGIERDLRKKFGSGNVTRLNGPDRYSTSAAINNHYFGGGTVRTQFFATGTGFADALSGGASAGYVKAPLVVTAPTCVPKAAAKSVNDRQTSLVYLVGGKGALSNSVANMQQCAY